MTKTDLHVLFKNKHLPLIFLLILPILIASLPDSYEEKVRAAAAKLLFAPLKITRSIEKETSDFLRPRGASRKIALLEEKLLALSARNAAMEELRLENERLRALLLFKKSAHFSALPVSVISRDASNYRKSIIIDKGSSSGVNKNAYIVTEAGLAGRVYEAAGALSKAILITDPEFRVAAMVHRSRESGVICGNGTPLCVLKYLSAEADVKIGDIVVSSGFGGFCPKGLVIGEVASIEKSDDLSGIQARVRPAVRAGSIEEALVILEGR